MNADDKPCIKLGTGTISELDFFFNKRVTSIFSPSFPRLTWAVLRQRVQTQTPRGATGVLLPHVKRTAVTSKERLQGKQVSPWLYSLQFLKNSQIYRSECEIL